MAGFLGRIWERFTGKSRRVTWEQAWDARQKALESVLGPTDGTVLHAITPLDLGGQADALTFPSHLPGGYMMATCDLLDAEGQVRNKQGRFELAIASREHGKWHSGIISMLAPYTITAAVNPGETMDFSPVFPEGSTLDALLFCDYARFTYKDEPAGLLLCIGITGDELAMCQGGETDRVLSALKDKGVFPYTDFFRESVV